MALAYVREEPHLPSDVLEKLREATFLLRNVANNTNQLAHAINIEAMKDGYNPTAKDAYEIFHSIFKQMNVAEQRIRQLTSPIKNHDT